MQLRLVAELLPYARNSKTHSPAQVTVIANSIKRFGWTNPCLIAGAVILAGHGRIMAAKQLGLTKVPCIDLSHLSEEDRRAYVIMDNRSAETGASWDLEMLKVETDELRDLGLDLEAVTGWAEDDLAALFAGIVDGGDSENEGDPDAVPDLPEEPISQVGDVWVMGRHRLLVGDSTTREAWDICMAGGAADVAFTDPPYNVDVATKNKKLDRLDGMNRSKSGAIQNDKMTSAAFADFIGRAFDALYAVLEPGATVYVSHSDKEAGAFRACFDDAGFKFLQTLIWRKSQLVLGMSKYQPIHEPIIMGTKPGAKMQWYGGRKQTTLLDFGDDTPFRQLEDGRWCVKMGDSILYLAGDVTVEEAPTSFLSVPKPSKSGLHPTTKPIELVERLLNNSARRGAVVADGFGGSGSTLIAAERLGMCARIIELNEGYADTIVKRWQLFTGEMAFNEATGEAFSDGELGVKRASVEASVPDIF